MIIHNLLSVHWTSISCQKPLLDEMSIICMEKPPQIPISVKNSMPRSVRPSGFVCDDETIISYYFILSYMGSCSNKIPDHLNHDHVQTIINSNLSSGGDPFLSMNGSNGGNSQPLLPSILCKLVLQLNINISKQMCPEIMSPGALKECISTMTGISELTINVTQEIRSFVFSDIETFCVYDSSHCSNLIGYHNMDNTSTILWASLWLRITKILIVAQPTVMHIVTHVIWCYTDACIMTPKLSRATGTCTVFLICPPGTIPHTITYCSPGYTVIPWAFEIDIFLLQVLQL